MYLSHYNLQKEPFQITSDPDFLWLGEQHLEALSTLQYGIQQSKGFLLLTGDVGTGKTVLINRLVTMIDDTSIVADLADPGLGVLDFFNHLSEVFKIGQTFTSKGAFLAHLRKFLHQTAAQNKSVLLIIDEAQRLNHELLEEIRLLSNIELNNRKLINIFFVGQTEFNDTLMQSRNKAVRHRIAVRYHIYPLKEKETADYIVHRLNVAGREQQLFASKAIDEIFAFSGGNPRLINIICDHALLTGYSADLDVIDAEVIKECASELRLPAERRKKKKKKEKPPVETKPEPKPKPKPKSEAVTTQPSQSSWLLIAGAIVIIGGLIVYFGLRMYTQKSETRLPWSIDEMAPEGPKGILDENSDRQESPEQIVDTQQPDTGPATETTGAPKTIQPDINRNEASQVDLQSELDLTKVQKIIIRFNHNSNELSAETYKTLDRIAWALHGNQFMNIDVKGYTDATGSLSYNMSISKFRANIIKTYLAGKGIDPARITAIGLGPENPIASNDTAEGKRQNRRVEIEFNKSPE